MSVIIDVFGPRGLGFAREPDRGGRGRCWEDGSFGRAAVPSGRVDGRVRGRGSCAIATRAATWGKGTLDAVAHVNEEIADALVGVEADDQRFVDDIMLEVDGTDNKGALGANAILGASLAVAKAAAESAELPLYKYVGGVNAHLLPTPMMNILNGGVHADNNVDFQEFMIMPVGADSFAEALPLVRGDLPHAEKSAARCGPRRRRGRRGRLRSQLHHERGAAGIHRARLRGGRLQTRHGHHVRHGSGFHRVLRRREAALRAGGRGPRA